MNPVSTSRAGFLASSMFLVLAGCGPRESAVEIPKDAAAIEFVYENDEIGTADNSPMTGETFVFNHQAGKAELAAGNNFAAFTVSASADFRNTIFDFTSVPREHRVITFASVTVPNVFEYYAALHAEDTPKVYFNGDHVAIPLDLGRMPTEGPFARLKFQCSKAAEAVPGISIKLFGPAGFVAETVSNEDGTAEVTVGNVTFPTIRFSATIPGSAHKLEGLIAIPIVGATEDLIHYHSIPIEM